MSSQKHPGAEASNTTPSSRFNPYVGPRPFQPGEELFGRDREKRELFDQLIADRIVLLHSPSGAGKTSLVMAGLIPQLEKEGLHVLPVVRVGEEPPEEYAASKDFNRFIFSVMLYLDGETLEQEQTQPVEMEEGIRQAKRKARLEKLASMTLQEYLKPTQESLETRLNVIIFDQFEEVITTAPTDLASKRTFFEQIGEVLRDRSIWALFVIRDDFLGALEPFALSIPTQLTNTYRLDLLAQDAARQAIQKPVARQSITFLDSAAQKLVDDLRIVQTQSPGGEIVSGFGLYVEPVQLQVVCRRLYDQLELATRLDKNTIDDDDIKKIGDVGDALGKYYAEQVAISADSQSIERQIRDWFDDKLIVKDRLRNQVMMEIGASGGLENEIIRQLEKAHLVRAEKRRGVTWFELAHDRLIQPVLKDNERWRRENLNPWQLRALEWQKNNRPDSLLLRSSQLDQALSWAAEYPTSLNELDRDYLQASSKWREVHLSPLQRKAADWDAHGRPPNLLLVGGDLEQAANWATTNTDELTSREMEFLEMSRAAALEKERQREKEQRELEQQAIKLQEQARHARRLNLLLIVTLLAAVAALFFAGTSYISQQKAQEVAATNAALAETNSQIAGVAQANAATALFASTQAYNDQGTAVAANQTAQAASTDALDQQATAVFNADLAATNEANAFQQANIAFSRQLAVQARSFLTRRPELGILLAVEAFKADSMNWDARSVLLEALRTGLEQSVVPYETNIPAGQTDTNNLSITPDGKKVIWSGSEGKIMLWDVATKSTRPLEDPEGIFVTAQAISPTNPNLLVTGNLNSELLFWNLSDGTSERVDAVGISPTKTQYNHGRIRRLAFSHDGKRLAIHGQTANIAIWDVASRTQLVPIKSNSDFYWDIDWSPNDRYLAAAGGDNYLYVFDPLSGKPIDREPNPDAKGRIFNIDWSPDSKTLAFVGASGTGFFEKISFFDLANRAFLPDNFQSASSSLYAVSYNAPKGDLIVAAGFNTPVEVWRVSDGTQYPPLPAYHAYQTALDFYNGLLAYVGTGTVSVYELNDPEPLGHDLKTFSGNNPAILSTGEDELWLAGITGGNLVVEQRTGNESQSNRFPIKISRQSEDDAVTLSKDTTLYIVPQGTGDLYRWNPATDNTELIATEFPTTTHVLAANSAVNRLAAGFCENVSIEQLANQCSVQLFDLTKRSFIGQPISTTQSTMSSLAFNPDGSLLASGDRDGSIYLIDVASRKPGEIPLGGFNVRYTSLAFSPINDILAAGSDQGSLFLWDMASGQVFDKPFQIGNQPITGLDYSPDGKSLYVTMMNGQTSIWDVDFDSWVKQACLLAGRSLTDAEWHQFFDDQKYDPACQDDNLATATITASSTSTPTP